MLVHTLSFSVLCSWMQSSIKPIVTNEVQLLYLCHLFGPVIGRLKNDRPTTLLEVCSCQAPSFKHTIGSASVLCQSLTKFCVWKQRLCCPRVVLLTHWRLYFCDLSFVTSTIKVAYVFVLNVIWFEGNRKCFNWLSAWNHHQALQRACLELYKAL